jgi:hypothetical protein
MMLLATGMGIGQRSTGNAGADNGRGALLQIVRHREGICDHIIFVIDELRSRQKHWTT